MRLEANTDAVTERGLVPNVKCKVWLSIFLKVIESNKMVPGILWEFIFSDSLNLCRWNIHLFSFNLTKLYQYSLWLHSKKWETFKWQRELCHNESSSFWQEKWHEVVDFKMRKSVTYEFWDRNTTKLIYLHAVKLPGLRNKQLTLSNIFWDILLLF